MVSNVGLSVVEAAVFQEHVSLGPLRNSIDARVNADGNYSFSPGVMSDENTLVNVRMRISRQYFHRGPRRKKTVSLRIHYVRC